MDVIHQGFHRHDVDMVALADAVARILFVNVVVAGLVLQVEVVTQAVEDVGVDDCTGRDVEAVEVEETDVGKLGIDVSEVPAKTGMDAVDG